MIGLKYRLHIVSLGALLGLALVAGSGCMTVDPVTGQPSRNFYQPQDDIQIGTRVHANLVGNLQAQSIPINQDPARLAQLETMVQRIGAISHIPDFPYKVTLVHSNVANALAAPGGQLVVFEGLYAGDNRLVEDEDELATVVAHEIAHATCRHVTKSMTRALPVELAMMGAAIYAEVAEKDKITSVLGGTMLVYKGLVLTAYSRQDEEEADRIGMEYMARAGYDPAAAVRLWERVGSSRQPTTAGFLNYLSTHPSATDRHRNLSRLLPAMQRIYERTRDGAPEPVLRHMAPLNL